jgi:hypothetical protein
MLVDVIGKINNMKLAKSNALLPLFEAVINSLQSIEELNDSINSYIKIILKRDLSQQAIDNEGINRDGSMYPIQDIIVEDNGTGFNDNNFNSFQTSDSTYKLSKGGKGVGRFLWLKAFERVYVESNYKDCEIFKYREFVFSKTSEPVSKVVNKIDGENNFTKITLSSFLNPYKDSCPKRLETIALKIVEHSISYFILNTCPRITIEDEFDKICLNDLFKNQICVNTDVSAFHVKDEVFSITHVKLFMNDEKKNRIHLCANKREVTRKDLSKSIPNLVGKIRAQKENEDEFIYSAYISGEILDKSVNLERTDFNILDGEEEALPGLITLKDIEQEVVNQVKEYLADYIEPIKEEKIKKITNYINGTSPQYKTILKYKKEKLDGISPKISESDLEIELFKISQELNLEIKKEGQNILNKKFNDIKDLEEYKKQCAKFIEKENDIGKSSLAQYIIHRRVILELLENGLSFEKSSRYQLEEYVHNLIFPMRTTSDEINYEKHNMWIIDEKLSYHYYLASDLKLKKMESISVDGDERPDILIMDNPVILVNQESKPYNSVVIIEFKRPMRNDYNEDSNNPINQVFKYVKKIRNGAEVDRLGRPITIGQNTPFYLYIIADLTSKMVEDAELANLTRTPDNMGFFGYNTVKDINAYIEVISYDKLVEDAKKRNKILFDKLFTPTIDS